MSKINFTDFIEESKIKFGNNLKAIILFGSGANSDFMQGVSDLDFIFIFEHLDFKTINIMEKIEFEFSERFGSRVDIKPFTKSELLGAIKGIHSFGFFNGWALRMIEEGKQKLLYKTQDLSLEYQCPIERIRKDALDRASFYTTKLRKIMFLKRTMILDGEVRVLSDKDLIKICVSCCKNVLTFCLAYKGIVCDDVNSTIKSAERVFGSMNRIKRAYEIKQQGKFDIQVLKDAYELVEEVYEKTIS